MKFVTGMVLGVMLSVGGVSLYAQNERAMHPRIAAAITALKDARAYMAARRTISADTRRMRFAPRMTRSSN